MKTSSYLKNKVSKKAEKFFDKPFLNRLAKASGFVRRTPQKITAFAFVAGFIESIRKGGNTYSLWAAKIGELTGGAVSKQALFERMSERSVKFSEQLLEKALAVRLKTLRKDNAVFAHFKRVLLQDSTTLHLPDVLAEFFPGTVHKGVQKATARLQCILNLKTMHWLELSLKSFCDNDQGASGDVLPRLRKGDLLIRDLGYFVLDVFEQITQKKAFFLSRLRYGVNLYDEKGREIHWKQMARKRAAVDRWVWIGAEARLKVRLVLIALPQEQAAERVRRAKADRDKRLNHSEEYYQWLHYHVFITNAEEEKLPVTQVATLYGVRWQIEILFKAFKSGLHLQQMLHEKCPNLYRAKTSIYLLLMWFCRVVQKVYRPYAKSIRRSHGKEVSLLKLFVFVGQLLHLVLYASKAKLKEQLVKHCCYEKRKDRTNMIEHILTLNLATN